jgi:hypothetical protein
MGNDSLKEITMVKCTKQGGQVLYRGRHYIPEKGPLRRVFATVPDRHFGSGSGSELNHLQIDGPGCQYTRTVNPGSV